MSRRLVKNLLVFASASLVAAVAMAGCTFAAHNYQLDRAHPIYVQSAPPAPQSETQTAAPSPESTWVPGEWSWSETDDQWKWLAGSWQNPPEGATWQPGTYETREDGQGVYTPGYWRSSPSIPLVEPVNAGKSEPIEDAPDAQETSDVAETGGPAVPSATEEEGVADPAVPSATQEAVAPAPESPAGEASTKGETSTEGEEVKDPGAVVGTPVKVETPETPKTPEPASE